MQQEEKPSPLQLATKAIMYMPICENNPVAAAIVDCFYSFSEFSERVGDHEDFLVYVESAYGILSIPMLKTTRRLVEAPTRPPMQHLPTEVTSNRFPMPALQTQ